MPDLVVVGGGPGGTAAALTAARTGAQVTLIERANLGGVCVHAGCIPAGAFHRTISVYDQARSAERVGVAGCEPHVDFARMHAWVGHVVNEAAARTRMALEFAGVEVISGAARFTGPGRLEAGGRSFEGVAVVLATGARSEVGGLPGTPARVLTNDEAMALAEPPASLAVLGAQRFSLEWADFFHALGSQVTLVTSESRILPAEDAELAEFLQMMLEERGVRFLLGAELERIDGTIVRAGDDKIETDAVLVADHRVPNVGDLGLEAGGVVLAPDGGIAVDETCKTSVDVVWAVGDVTGPPWLSNRASAMGAVAARNALGEKTKLRPERIPRSVNTHPELAAVGFTVDEARAKGIQAESLLADLAANLRAVTLAEERGALKLVVDTEFGEILGAHMVGPGASEVIAQVVTAMELEADYRDLAKVAHIHPSLAELVTLAAGSG